MANRRNNNRKGSVNRPASRNHPAAKQGMAARPAAAVKHAPARTASRRFTLLSGTGSKDTLRDYTLIFVVIFLLIFGLVILYSTSSYESALEYGGDAAYYLKHQLLSTIIGLGFMVFVSRLNYHVYEKMSTLIYLASVVLVVLVQFIGVTRNGAKRWIYIGPLSLQPAEIAKIAVIIVTAVIITRISENNLKTIKGAIYVMMPAMLHVVLIYVITRNLSSAIIVAAIAAGMLFVASKDYLKFFVLGFGVIGAAALWVYRAVNSIGEGNFRSQRILAWLDPAAYADVVGFQTLQALYGIGSGGIIGKGLGQSMQKLGYIPEAQNDMIFSIICEELGLFGAISIIMLFVILCWRIMIIATNAPDLFGGMIATGVMVHIAVQVILNIAVVTNTIPNTGISLPFISYGGSSVMFLLAEIGMVISVSREIRLKEIGKS